MFVICSHSKEANGVEKTIITITPPVTGVCVTGDHQVAISGNDEVGKRWRGPVTLGFSDHQWE